MPINTNFEGERAPKNRVLLSKFSKKCPKTAFLTCFFNKLPAAQKIWPKQGLFTALGARKINLIDLKKRSSKFSKTF